MSSAATGDKVMRAPRAGDPARVLCRRCSEPVLRVHVEGTPVLVEIVEFREDRVDNPTGLFVGLGADGAARAVRLPTGKRPTGEALHVPHQLRCRPGDTPSDTLSA